MDLVGECAAAWEQFLKLPASDGSGMAKIKKRILTFGIRPSMVGVPRLPPRDQIEEQVAMVERALLGHADHGGIDGASGDAVMAPETAGEADPSAVLQSESESLGLSHHCAVWENECWWPTSWRFSKTMRGLAPRPWSAAHLHNDNHDGVPPWSNETFGLMRATGWRTRDEIPPTAGSTGHADKVGLVGVSQAASRWAGPWKLDLEYGDAQGWQYNVGFIAGPRHWSSKNNAFQTVRRRLWYRPVARAALATHPPPRDSRPARLPVTPSPAVDVVVPADPDADQHRRQVDRVTIRVPRDVPPPQPPLFRTPPPPTTYVELENTDAAPPNATPPTPTVATMTAPPLPTMLATSGTIGLQLTISSGGDATLHILGLDLENAIPNEKMFVSAQFVDHSAGTHARHARRRTKALKGVATGAFTHLDLNQFLVWGSKDEVADCKSGTLTVRLHKKLTLGSTVLARANLPVREVLQAGLVTCKLGLPADGSTVLSFGGGGGGGGCASAEAEHQITPATGNDTALRLQFEMIMSSPHANFSKLALPQVEELLVAAHGVILT